MTLEEVYEKLSAQIKGVDESLSTQIKEVDERLSREIQKTNDRLDMTNLNIAKILEQQVETRKELNEKMDRFIAQNNVEHKQFAYQIAQLEMKNGITKIG